MPRHISSEGFQMDHLRSSPSQQHLDPSRTSSLQSGAAGGGGLDDEDDERHQQGAMMGASGRSARPHKLDLYSIPVFLLEVLVLMGLAYCAYYVHFQYQHEPLISGFYCDDISLRQQFRESTLTKHFTRQDNELFVLGLLVAVPIALIIFCELVNSMFGALKFRQIRALCACCKLHSITRRTIRFSGAYLLGFLIVILAYNILADSFGRLRPSFAQECPRIYTEQCLVGGLSSSQPSSLMQRSRARDVSSSIVPQTPPPVVSQPATAQLLPNGPAPGALGSTVAPVASAQVQPQLQPTADMSSVQPPSQPISSLTSQPQQVAPNNSLLSISTMPPPAAPVSLFGGIDDKESIDGPQQEDSARFRRDTASERRLIERKWIDLNGANLKRECDFSGDQIETHIFEQVSMSWPSFPAAIVTYACLFCACYLSYVGTARPFRLITCVLVMVLLLLATVFNVQLVKAHYNHWEDVAAGGLLALVVVLFVLLVYLNKFKDTHYYELQKNPQQQYNFRFNSQTATMARRNNKSSAPPVHEHHFGSYNNEAITTMGHYNLDKTTDELSGGNQNGDLPGNSSQASNDLAMRYFQIPRANYRGAPRPLSSLNQMRS